MIINKMQKKRLLQMIEKELEYNPYDKELLNIKKELGKESTNFMVTEDDLENIKEWNNTFYQIGLFNSNDFRNLSKKEVENAIEIMKIMLKLREFSKELYMLAVEKNVYSNDKKKFLKYIDEYNLKVLEQYMKIAQIVS